MDPLFVCRAPFKKLASPRWNGIINWWKMRVSSKNIWKWVSRIDSKCTHMISQWAVHSLLHHNDGFLAAHKENDQRNKKQDCGWGSSSRLSILVPLIFKNMFCFCFALKIGLFTSSFFSSCILVISSAQIDIQTRFWWEQGFEKKKKWMEWTSFKERAKMNAEYKWLKVFYRF